MSRIKRGDWTKKAQQSSAYLVLILIIIIILLGTVAVTEERWFNSEKNVLTGAAISLQVEEEPLSQEPSKEPVLEVNQSNGTELVSAPVDNSVPVENTTPSAIPEDVPITLEEGITTLDAGDGSNCGTMGTSITLTTNLVANGSCFNITASNIFLDCAGRMINYSTTSSNEAAINNSGGYDNITIKNCVMVEGSADFSNNPTLYFVNSENNTIANNTILTLGSSSDAIRFRVSIDSIIANNTINTFGSSANAIDFLSSSAGNHILNNNLSTEGSSADAVTIGSTDILLYQNNITTTGSSANGINLAGNAFRINITSNYIVVSSSGGNVIKLGVTPLFTLLNNTLIATNQKYFIYPSSLTTGGNDIIYNNTYGELRWLDNGTESFPANMTLNLSNNAGFGFDRNLFMGNGTSAVNISAMSPLEKINGSIQLVFRNLGSGLLMDIKYVRNYTTNQTEILSAGINCTGSTCTLISFSQGTLTFNVTFPASYAVNVSADVIIPSIYPDAAINDTSVNTTEIIKLNATLTDNEGIDTVRFFIQGFGNLTASRFGSTNEYYLTCNSTSLCNTTNAGVFNWTSIWANDTFNNINTSAPNLQFNVSTDTISPTISADQTINDTSVNTTEHIRLNVTINDTYGVDTVRFFIQGFGNLTASRRGNTNEYYITCNSTSLCNTTSAGVFNWTSIWANDTSNNINTSAPDLQFNVSTDTISPAISTDQVINDTSVNISEHIRLNVTINDTYGVDTVRFFIQGFGNLTASRRGSTNEYYLTCNSTSLCNTTSAGVFNWTSIWANDTSNNINTSAPDLQFNVSLGCGSSIISSTTLASDLPVCANRGITLANDNIILDCAGKSLTGSGGDNGVYVSKRRNISIKNCVISGFSYGINLSHTNSSFVLNNTVRANGIAGVGLEINNTYNLIANNTILSSNFANFGYGIYIHAPIWKSSPGEFEEVNNSRNRIEGNNVSHHYTGIQAGGMEDLYLNNVLDNNTFGFSNSFFTGGSGAIPGTLNFTLGKVRNSGQGFYIAGGNANRVNIYHVLFESNVYDTLAFSSSLGGLDVFIINSTVDKSKIIATSSMKTYVKWHTYVNVTDKNNNPLVNATVDAYNSVNELDFTANTSSDGNALLEMTEFFREGDTNYYVTPSTIKAHKSNYTYNTTTIDLTNITSAQRNLSLQEITCGVTLVQDADLGNNYNCAGTGLVIGADSITIKGNNINFTGSGTGTGINLSGRSGIKIEDLKISKFNRGIDFLQTNNSNFSGLLVVNNTYGIIFNNSHNNLIYNSTFDNNTFDIYAINDGGTNNSLINVTIDVNNITVEGTATVYRRWYVYVNVTFNSLNTALVGALVNGSFAESGLADDLRNTDNNGITRLELAELKKNSSGITYLTPHNITISFTFGGTTTTNTTSINLSQTNNTQVNFHLNLNCTTPANHLRINTSTTLCPGTYDAYNVTVSGSNITITCVDTVIDTSKERISIYSKSGIIIENTHGVVLKGCQIKDQWYGIKVSNSRNVTLYNNTLTNNGIYCYNSTLGNISYNSVSRGTSTDVIDGITLHYCNGNVVAGNVLTNLWRGIILWGDYDSALFTLAGSDNNTLYYNEFLTIDSSYYQIDGTTNSYTNSYNTSTITPGNISAQGNKYGDYCGKGKDLNGDGYADNVSSFGAGDWPYNETTTNRISAPGINVTDYGPQMFDCVTEVRLGSTSTGGSSSAA
ncbi:TPA: hypothetical protein HA242_06405, partial [Candidatus Woesearchaeota archaeon]|nr:hypothetical protein [Candidatus Woesearchaeota archaeon]